MAAIVFFNKRLFQKYALKKNQLKKKIGILVNKRFPRENIILNETAKIDRKIKDVSNFTIDFYSKNYNGFVKGKSNGTKSKWLTTKRKIPTINPHSNCTM